MFKKAIQRVRNVRHKIDRLRLRAALALGRDPNPELMVRLYDGAQMNRLTNDWIFARSSANWEVRLALRILRSRCRDLARNNDYIKKFLSIVVSQIIGPAGIRLSQVLQGMGHGINQPLSLGDKVLVQAIMKAWDEWSNAENCSASNKLSWVDAQRLATRQLARDGEFLLQMCPGNSETNNDKVGPNFSIKLIDASWLDENHNEEKSGGNRVIMGVEVDKYDKLVGVWLTPLRDEFLGSQWRGRQDRTFVPANQIVHGYLVLEDEAQTRGIPWAHTAIVRLQMLGGYQEAELVAARVEACKMGIFEEKASADPMGLMKMAGAAPGEEPKKPQIQDEAAPGQFMLGPPGYEFKMFDPKHPNSNHGEFVKAMLRGIASGLEVPYISLGNDLTGVSYSSIRAGLLEERDLWKALQLFMQQHFCRPVFIAWLRACLLNESIPGLTAETFKRIVPSFRARGWDWVDPQKDINATILGIQWGLDSRRKALSEKGEVYDEIVQDLMLESELAEELGVPITVSPAANPGGTPAGDNPDNPDNPDDTGTAPDNEADTKKPAPDVTDVTDVTDEADDGE